MRTIAIFLSFCIFPTLFASAQIAKDKCKFLGNVIAGNVPADFNDYWNQVTPENSGKWGVVEPVRDEMDWDGLDLAYDHAKQNGLPFRQHTFVWGQQQPAWITALSAEEQKAEVEEWIKEFGERYPETDFIDVVNEPLHALPGYRNALGGAGTTGWDWLIWTFEKAREYCPNAKLFLNDYNIISSDASTTSYINIINLLKERNLIDGVGEQGHFLETTPLATVTSNLNKLKATGLPIHITEFDLNFASDTEQQTRYQQLFPILWGNSAVEGITLWGYRQGSIWRENAYLVKSNNSARPALTWLTSFVESDPGGFFCEPVVGVEDSEKTGLSVQPNPVTNGRFELHLEKDDNEIRITNLQGMSVLALGVMNRGSHIIRIDIAPGIYILQAAGNGVKDYKKIIVR